MTDDFTKMDIDTLQHTLQEDGVILHEDQLEAQVQ